MPAPPPESEPLSRLRTAPRLSYHCCFKFRRRPRRAFLTLQAPAGKPMILARISRRAPAAVAEKRVEICRVPRITRSLALALSATLPFAALAQEETTQTQRVIAAERRSVIVEAVQRVSPSVASVVVSGVQRVPIFNDPFYREFFGFGR